jgi:hypothetical protein
MVIDNRPRPILAYNPATPKQATSGPSDGLANPLRAVNVEFGYLVVRKEIRFQVGHGKIEFARSQQFI